MAALLSDLRLGRVALDFPVVQAALSGYSDWAMRVIARRLGAPYTLCEVMLDQFLLEASHTRKNRGRLRPKGKMSYSCGARERSCAA